ncbi:MAG TPA: hypothetical protein VGD49_08835 [Longimicrobiales bacterium]
MRAAILAVTAVTAVFLMGACDGEVPLGNTPQGTIRVVVSGHAPSLANAGQARYASGTIDLVVPIPVAGMLEASVPVGTYHVTYTPPTGYSLSSGQQAQRDIVINAGAMTEVAFALVANPAPTGTVRVTVTGLTGATSGGSAAVLRTDITGQNSINVNVPAAGGNVDTQVATGTYRVTYTPPTGFQLATGQTNPQNLTVAQNGTSTASFQVQASGGGGGGGGGGGTVGALFFSDWRNQLGATVTALSDGGKWRLSSGAEQNGSIVDAPAGFSTHKVLRVLTNGHRDGWITPYLDNLGEVPIGSTRNYRWEHAFHEPALSDAGQHPIQDGGAVSQSNWYMGTSNTGSNLQAGQWGLNYAIGGNPEWNDDMYTLGSSLNVYTPLQKGVVYRHEVQLVRISATQFRFHVWVHDASGNLLYDDDDFRNRPGTRHIGQVTHTFQVAANMSIWMMGLNGITGGPWPVHSSDQAAAAIVQGLPEGTQIGPYGSVQGEVRR